MRLKRALIATLVTAAVLTGTGAAAAATAVSDEQVLITSPLPGTAAWDHDRSLGRPLPDPAHASPAAVAAFFAGLSAERRQRLAERYPLVVGNLDGAPVELRYQANRIALRQALAAAERTADGSDAGSGSGSRSADASAREEARNRAQTYQSLLRPGRQILAFDPRGRGKLAEVFGDLATAKRVAVLVPGSDVDLTHYENLGSPLKVPAGMAQSLRAQEIADDPGTGTAVIAWADYTTPVGLGADAATSRLAQAAVPGLLRLLAGLRETSDPVAPPTLLCHSYGSVVCGLAAPSIKPRRGEPTDMVVFGSPGLGVSSAARLGRGVRLWATRNATDWIANVPYLELEGLGHGADPTSTTFGSRVLSSAGAAGHTGYFAPGTDSLLGFADVALGRYREVPCAEQDPGCASGL